jgi:hypothetical protein
MADIYQTFKPTDQGNCERKKETLSLGKEKEICSM